MLRKLEYESLTLHTNNDDDDDGKRCDAIGGAFPNQAQPGTHVELISLSNRVSLEALVRHDAGDIAGRFVEKPGDETERV